MRRIGIDQQYSAIYENEGSWWRILRQTPMLSPAIFVLELPVEFVARPRGYEYLFREDTFDPTARIRRGRFYELANSEQPSMERVLRRDAGDSSHDSFQKPLFVYDQLMQGSRPEKLVALGSAESLWRIVSTPERISTGEFLFVLKARHSFGVLPEIDLGRVPENGRAQVHETLDGLTDAAHRAPPSLIIESARAAAQCCLGTWAAWNFEDTLLRQFDLGRLIRRIEEVKRGAARAAEVIRILHPRVKPNEQEKYQSRPPMEDNGELAVKAVAFIIRELGWASD